MKPDTEWAETSPGLFARRYRGLDLRVVYDDWRGEEWCWQVWLNYVDDWEPAEEGAVTTGILNAQVAAEAAADACPFAEERP